MNNYIDNLVTDINYDIIPSLIKHINLNIGDFKISALTSDSNGWLVCNGRSLLIEDYPELYNVIGSDYGSPGEGYFNLPDFTSKVLGMFGLSSVVSELTVRNRGDIVGTEEIILTNNNLPTHNHTGTVNSSGSHTHNITDSGHTHTGTVDTSGLHTHSITDVGHTHTATTDSNGNHTHSITDPGHTHTQTTINDDFNSSGANPPGFAADSAGSRTWSNINSSTTGITINSSGSHTHTLTSNSSTTGITNNNAGSHTHTFTSNSSATNISINNNGSHTHTFTTGNTGQGESHTNMQPTLFGVNVMIFSKFLY